MIDDIIKILKLYLVSLDREYDNDMIILTEKILRELDITRENVTSLLSAVPADISDSMKDSLKMLLK